MSVRSLGLMHTMAPIDGTADGGRVRPGARTRLAPRQFRELNATLYSSNPASYSRLRLQSLLAALAEPPVDQSPRLLAYGAITAELPPILDDEAARLRFAAMDSTVLLHHAGETIFRLYAAHRDEPGLVVSDQLLELIVRQLLASGTRRGS